MRDPTRIASSIEWVTNNMVKAVCSHRLSSSSCILRRVSASSAANGSSISRMAGSMASARAIATRIFMPPDNVCGNASTKRPRPTFSITSSARGPISRAGKRRVTRIGNITFSRTLFHGSNCSNSWNTISRSGPGCVISLPSSFIEPDTGGRKPPTALRIEDLPQPEGPSSTKRSPR